MKPVETLSRLGFDQNRLRYSIRTALGSCLALLIAWLVGLEHPQWAAMTVFAASQPPRNMLVEKVSFGRSEPWSERSPAWCSSSSPTGRRRSSFSVLPFGSVFARGPAISCAGSWRTEPSSLVYGRDGGAARYPPSRPNLRPRRGSPPDRVDGVATALAIGLLWLHGMRKTRSSRGCGICRLACCISWRRV